MSSRPQFSPFSVITNGDMSGNITSKVTIIQKLSLASYSIVWAGASPVGNIVVEVSNDFSENVDGSVKNPGTWNALPLDVATPVSGNIGNGFVDIDAQAGYALRIRYAFTSGIGSMNVVVAGKVA